MNYLSPLGLAYLALACALASGVLSLGADRYASLLRYGSTILLGAAGLAAVGAGGWSLLHESRHADPLLLGLPWLKWHVRLDPLSGFFFVVVGLPWLRGHVLLDPLPGFFFVVAGLLVAAGSLYAPGYLREFAHRQNIHSRAALGVATALFVLGTFLVLLADDAFVFMIAWELMSVSSYFL